MATRAKKLERRKRRRDKQHNRRQRRAIQASAPPSEFLITAEEGAASGFEILEAADDAGGEKKLKRFRMSAYTGGRLMLANFFYPVVVDLSGIKVPARSRPILRDHDPGRIVGHTTDITVNAGSIRVEGVISAANETAREVAESAANGFPWEASIGAKAQKMSFVDKGETVSVNGRKFTGPVYVARQSTLGEVSFVALGADEGGASATVAAKREKELDTMNDFEKWLKAKGFDAEELTDEQKKPLKAAFDAEEAANRQTGGGSDDGDPPDKPNKKPIKAADNPPDENDPPADPIAATRAETAAELKRQKAIRAICAKYDDPKLEINGKEEPLDILAIEENWTVERAELEALRASRPKAPAGHVPQSNASEQALQGAIMLRAGAPLDGEHFQSPGAYALELPAWLRADVNSDQRQRAMEAAHRLTDLSLYDFCRHACALEGKRYANNKEMIRAAFSGGTLTNIFTTSVNAILLQTLAEAPDTTGPFTMERDVSDFKTQERPRMTKGPDLARLPRGGTADHVDRSDTAETYKIARYAKQWTVDEQDVIDDRLDALADTPREMGLAAARLRPDLVYSILLANANLADAVALFNDATRGNLDTGSALADTTLRAGVAAMLLFQESGVNLNVRPTHILVPPTLKHLASELINSSQLLAAGTAGTVTIRGNQNPILDDNLGLISDARLENGVTDPASGTTYSGANNDWYLVSSMLRSIEVGYLRGTGRVPQLTRWNKMGEDGQWLVGFSIKLDIGAKATHWQGLYKAEG